MSTSDEDYLCLCSCLLFTLHTIHQNAPSHNLTQITSHDFDTMNRRSTIDMSMGGVGNRRRTRSGDGGGGDLTSSLTYSPFSSFVTSTETTSRPSRMSRSMLGNSRNFGSGIGHHHQHNTMAAGTVGDSAASMRWKPSYNIRDNYRLSDVSDMHIGSSTNLSPHPLHSSLNKPPSPPSGGRDKRSTMPFRKLRGSTWDAAASMSMGKLSPKISHSKSNSMDGSSPTNPPALPYGQNIGDSDASKFIFEEGEEELFDSESDKSVESYHGDDINICEEKEEESVDEGEHDLMVTVKKLGSSLDPVSEVETEASPQNEASGGPLGQRRKSILKHGSTFGNSNHRSDSGTSKGVQFCEAVSEFEEDEEQDGGDDDKEEESEEDEAGRRESRPSYCAKLPALQKWDGFDDEEDIGSTITSTSPGARRDNRAGFTHFDRKNSQSPPSLLSRLNCSWSLIGSCIVRTAPCFWCSKKLSISSTDREILLRLNRLCAFFSLLQICYGVFTLVMKFITYDDDQADSANDPDKEGVDKPWFNSDLWSLDTFVIALSAINFVLLIASMLAQRSIRDVNLVGAVRFMWVLFWLLPLQIFFTIGLFDVYRVSEVRTKHFWDDPSLSMARRFFCDEGTANDQCMVPVEGGEDYDTEEQWCQAYYNATNCEDIRDDAQFEYNVAIHTANIVNGIWGLILVVLMWVTLCVLQAVITLSIVQRSKEANIPLWLTFPIIGCLVVGVSLQYSEVSERCLYGYLL